MLLLVTQPESKVNSPKYLFIIIIILLFSDNQDAVVLDWWMFTKTRIFGILIRQKTGKTPTVWSVEPQWDGKEIPKLITEVAVSAVLAWIFLGIFQ